MGLGWSTLAITAAAGALLVAVSVGIAGSVVAIAGALLIATALGVLSLVVKRVGLGGTRPRTIRVRPSERRPPPATSSGADRKVEREIRRESSRDDESDLDLAGTPVDGPWSPDVTLGGAFAAAVTGMADELAQEAVHQMRAPAAAVLVARGRRLVPAGSAGDWALAKRIQLEYDTADSDPTGSAMLQVDAGEGAPPELALDDFLPRLLGLYPRAVPMERWHELTDAPGALLPLAALADRGAAVAVALRHRRRLAGLWVLARRPGNRAYTDAELGTLERLARQAGPGLAAALERGD